MIQFNRVLRPCVRVARRSITGVPLTAAYGLLALLLSCPATSMAQEEVPSASRQMIRLQVVSTIPESLSYADQGFADFIRERKDVALTSLEINRLMTDSLLKSLSSAGLGVSLSPPAYQAATPEAINGWVAGLRARNDAEGLVVLSPGRTPSERGLQGMTVMTKIGMLGIQKLSIVFTMPKISIYTAKSADPCLELEPVRTKRIPAIYSSWSADMVTGPSDAVHGEMQAIVGSELPLAIEDAVTRAARGIARCLQTAEAQRVP